MTAPTMVSLRHISDPRGSLSVATFRDEVPFEIRRVFIVHDCKDYQSRGGHAHRDQAQFFIAVHGMVELKINFVISVHLHTPSRGLLVPAMNWVDLTMGHRAALLVLCPDVFCEDDYIRDRTIFEEETA
jgi:hypothetical protein